MAGRYLWRRPGQGAKGPERDRGHSSARQEAKEVARLGKSDSSMSMRQGMQPFSRESWSLRCTLRAPGHGL